MGNAIAHAGLIEAVAARRASSALTYAQNAHASAFILTGTGFYLWCDCATCGRTKPHLTAQGFVQSVAQDGPRILSAYCGTCLAVAPIVYVKNGHKRGAYGRCITSCLQGRSTCDCQCNGRCHGAGVCSCEVTK